MPPSTPNIPYHPRGPEEVDAVQEHGLRSRIGDLAYFELEWRLKPMERTQILKREIENVTSEIERLRELVGVLERKLELMERMDERTTEGLGRGKGGALLTSETSGDYITDGWDTHPR